MRVPLPIRAIPGLAFQAWLTPPPLAGRAERRFSQAMEGLARISVDGIDGYEIGDGPLVIGLHGWGGRAAQLTPIARRLAEDGFRVVVPDLPGGAGGTKTDIKVVARALRDLIDDVGRPAAIVAHSFASMVLRLTFDDDAPPAIVLVAPALRVTAAIDVFGDRLGLLPWARRGLQKRVKAWDPDLWPLVSGLQPDQFPDSEMLIIHDPADEDTPFAASAELAARRPGTEITPVSGTRHNGILSDPTAIELTSSFLTTRLERAA